MRLNNLNELEEEFGVFITDIFLYYKHDEQDYKEAILLSEEMINRIPNNLDAYMLLAFSKFRLGMRTEAFELYDRVLTMIDQESKFDSFREIMISEFGVNYEEIIEAQKQINELEKKLKVDQQDIDLFRNLGMEYFSTRNYYKAIDNYERYLKRNIDDCEFWFYLAEIYELVEDWENAIRCYEQAKEIDPKADKLFGYEEASNNKIIELREKLKKI